MNRLDLNDIYILLPRYSLQRKKAPMLENNFQVALDIAAFLELKAHERQNLQK